MNGYRIGTLAGWVSVIIGISIIIHVAIPDSVKQLAFSGAQFLAGEVWRFLTFPFVHVSWSHLTQNIIALVVAFLLMLEIKIFQKHFIAAFFGASFFVALIDLLAFPAIIIAGASVGAYSVFGTLSAKGSEFIPRALMIFLFGVPIVLQTFFIETTFGEVLPQLAFHLTGFIFGIGTLLIMNGIRKKKVRILEVVNEMS